MKVNGSALGVRLVHPWLPIADARSEVLVLGTMPSPASLQDGFYYGHRGNAFWRIMGELYGARKDLPPDQRGHALCAESIAAWDVLAACDRAGALDVDIKNPIPQDFARFYQEHPRVHTVVFNGGAAERFYTELVLPTLTGPAAGLRRITLPSTSPANRRPYTWKLNVWRAALQAALLGRPAPPVRDYLPFLPRFHDLVRERQKTMTCRGRIHGQSGDLIDTPVGVIEIKRVDKTTVGWVADTYYHEEGASTPSEFIEVWKELHGGRFDPDKTTFLHEFEYIGKVPQ